MCVWYLGIKNANITHLKFQKNLLHKYIYIGTTFSGIKSHIGVQFSCCLYGKYSGTLSIKISENFRNDLLQIPF